MGFFKFRSSMMFMFEIATVLVSPWGVTGQASESSLAKFPGSQLIPFEYQDYSDRDTQLGALALPANKNIKEMSELKFIKQDDQYSYYKQGTTAVFRKPHKPQPKMSYVDSRNIPEAPSLFWAGNLEFFSDDTAPAKPNCSESKFTFSDYLKILNDPKTLKKSDLLEKIPKDSLQKFTFIHHSESLQKHGVTKETPRVMRFSTDGKFIITYTTNADSYNYNSVEVMFFDDQTRRYNLAHTQFLSEDEIRQLQPSDSRTSKTVLNPKACLSCHGGNDPRPNWAQYQTWRGVYGSEDDLMPDSKEQPSIGAYGTIGIHETDLVDYTAMRKNLADTAELKTLPWPSSRSPIYDRYPYIKYEKEMDYNLRPNAHMTIVSSRVNAQRLARKIEEHPLFPKIKWSMLSMIMECRDLSHTNPLLSKIVAQGRRDYKETRPNSYGPTEHTGMQLYDITAGFGFMNSDWSLSFIKKPEPFFWNYSTAQWKMTDFVKSVLFRDLAKEETRLIPYDVRINRMSNLFGKNFSCVDEIADKLWQSQETHREACDIINEKVNSEIAQLSAEEDHKVEITKSKVWELQPRWLSESTVSLELGKKIVSTTCASCHSENVIPFNFKTMAEFSKDLNPAAKQAYAKHIEKILGSPQQCKMPLPIAGPCLSDTERKSVLMFLNSL